jgi:hypothetical protein
MGYFFQNFTNETPVGFLNRLELKWLISVKYDLHFSLTKPSYAERWIGNHGSISFNRIGFQTGVGYSYYPIDYFIQPIIGIDLIYQTVHTDMLGVLGNYINDQ